MNEEFLGLHVAEYLVDIVGGSFGCQKFAGAYVEKGYSDRRFVEMDCGQEVVFAMRQNVVVHCHTGSDEFDDAAFHELFR